MNDNFDKIYTLGYADAVDAIKTYIKANADSLNIPDLLEFIESLTRLNTM
ncbi:MAG: hypothetical protein MJZ12_00345 [Prevotella sp.]|nr:hypothetical protein [Prevotella sp.]